ncbi:hypothetical protein DRP07_00665 [Archaeoglobales archaeon]|nr:MAG: hypothetical protein DRP07_00665 [Archaeoglobales archaeon]
MIILQQEIKPDREIAYELLKDCGQAIQDEIAFEKLLDALECVTNMTDKEIKKLNEIKEKRDTIITLLYQKRREIYEKIREENEILRGTSELKFIDDLISKARYEFNLLRFKLLSQAIRKTDISTFAEKTISDEINRTFEKYLEFLRDEL